MTVLRDITQRDGRGSPHERLSAAVCGARVLEELQQPEYGVLLGGREAVSCMVDRVHFGSGLGTVIEYGVERSGLPGERLRIFGQLPAGDPRAAFETTRAKLASRWASLWDEDNDNPRLGFVPALGLILRRRGIDERIDGLWILRGRRQGALVDEPVGKLAESYKVARLLAHRLGKRAVVRLSAHDTGARSPAIMKLYRRGTATARLAARVHRHLVSQGFDGTDGLRVPRIEDGEASLAAILMECVPGTLACDLSGAERNAAMCRAGGGLARIHGARIEGLSPYGVNEEVDLLRRWLAFVSPLAPAIAPMLGQKLSRLEHDLASYEPFQACTIHRDFHEKQVICSGDTVTLTDFDTARLGDPAQDIGNFIAHLQLASLISGEAGQDAQDSFMRGYADRCSKASGMLSLRNVTWHIAATRLRLAMIHIFRDSRRFVVEPLIGGV